MPGPKSRSSPAPCRTAPGSAARCGRARHIAPPPCRACLAADRRSRAGRAPRRASATAPAPSYRPAPRRRDRRRPGSAGRGRNARRSPAWRRRPIASHRRGAGCGSSAGSPSVVRPLRRRHAGCASKRRRFPKGRGRRQKKRPGASGALLVSEASKNVRRPPWCRSPGAWPGRCRSESAAASSPRGSRGRGRHAAGRSRAWRS